MFSAFIRWLFQGALDTATYEAWLVVGTPVVAALALLWAYLRRAGRHILWYLAGVVSGLVLLLITTLILVGLGPKALLSVVLLALVGTAARIVLRKRRRELARLQGHPKGLLDFNKDFKQAAARNWKAMSRLTKETEIIAQKTDVLTGQLQSASSDVAKEAVLNRAARTYRKAATKYRRHATAFRQATEDFATAGNGILSWLQETGNNDQLRQQLEAIQGFRASALIAREGVLSFRQTIHGLPKMSQRLNAANADLVAAVDISLNATDAALAFADDALSRSPAR